MATSKKRARELARQRYERQQARRETTRHRARQRHQILASALAVLLVGGGVWFLTGQLEGRGGDTDLAAAGETPSAGPSPSPTAPERPTGDCTYTRVPEQGGNQVRYVGLPPRQVDQEIRYSARVTTNHGPISMDLQTSAAPCAVNSFAFLANKGYFDDTRCHRLLVGAYNALQCGDPSATGRGGPGYSFADENLENAEYERGVVAMANSGPDTNASQFFMVFGKAPFPPNYTPFARITSGLDVLEKIAKAGVTGPRNDTPKTKVV
ncbi:MAG: peptidylprolyl isomerase, partial [Streptomycetales bacterium]